MGLFGNKKNKVTHIISRDQFAERDPFYPSKSVLDDLFETDMNKIKKRYPDKVCCKISILVEYSNGDNIDEAIFWKNKKSDNSYRIDIKVARFNNSIVRLDVDSVITLETLGVKLQDGGLYILLVKKDAFIGRNDDINSDGRGNSIWVIERYHSVYIIDYDMYYKMRKKLEQCGYKRLIR